MCGRYVLKQTPAKLKEYFDLDEVADFGPHYNIPPGTGIPVIRQSPEGKRVLHLLRWGLVPNWAKEPSIGSKLNNARGERGGAWAAQYRADNICRLAEALSMQPGDLMQFVEPR